MASSQIFSVIFAALLAAAGKAREFLVSMAGVNFAVLTVVTPTVLNVVIAAIVLVYQLLAWAAISVKKFAIGLVHVTPLLFTAGFPPIFRRRYKGFPDTLTQMILQRPCPPHGTANFMAFLIDKGYPTAPFQFCVWFLDYYNRTQDEEYGFRIWSPTAQQMAGDLFAPGACRDRHKASVEATRDEVTPWELKDQPPSSILHASCYEEAFAITNHLFKTSGLESPYKMMNGNPYAKELQVVLATFFAKSGPLKLDMVSDVRISTLLYALRCTSHYTAFQWICIQCQQLLQPVFNEFHQKVVSMDAKGRVSEVLRLGITIGTLGFMTSIILVLLNVSAAIMLLPAIPLYVGFLIWIYALNNPCCAIHGFSHRHLRSWEVFLTADDYVKHRKEGSLFVGIAKEEALMSTRWSPEHTACIILWNNLYLTLADIFEKTIGEVYTVLFGNLPLIRFHEYRHKKYKKQAWVEKPAIYGLHNMVFYSAAFLSLFPTGIFTGFFLYCNWKFAQP